MTAMKAFRFVTLAGLPLALVACQWIADIDQKVASAGAGGSGAGGDPTASSTSSRSSTSASSSSSAGSGGTGGEPPCVNVCGDACVDLTNDPKHCGDCDRACDAGMGCDEGVCGRALFRGAGSDIASVAKSDGSLWVFGADTFCSAGTGDSDFALADPTKATRFSEPVRYAASASYTLCALLRSGAVECVGGNDNGEVGNGEISSAEACGNAKAVTHPYRTLDGDVVEIAGGGWNLGGSHFCARMKNGTVRCWGDVGGPCADRKIFQVPTRIQGVEAAIAIGVGAGFACAIIADGTLRCWGGNCNGELGRNTLDYETHGADEVPGLTGVTAVAAGMEHVCARAHDGVYCWGYNDFSQLGIDSGFRHVASPQRVDSPLLDDVVALAAGYANSCALTAGGQLSCWGANVNGVLGQGNLEGDTCPSGNAWCVHEPVLVPLASVVEVSIGDSDILARVAGGSVYTWGGSSYGALGLGVDNQTTATPTPLPGFP